MGRAGLVSVLLLGSGTAMSLAAEVPLPTSDCTGFTTSYDADRDTTTWTASSSLTCGSGEAVSVQDEGQSLIIDVGTYDVVFDGVTFDIGSFATSSCSGGASLDIIGDAAEGSVTFNGSGSETALSLRGNGADVDVNVPAFFNDWRNGAFAAAESSCPTKLTFGSDAIFTGITRTGLSGFETTWEVQGRAAFYNVAEPVDQIGIGQQSRFGTCVELGPGVPLPASTAFSDAILPFELCEDAIYAPVSVGIDLPNGCGGMTKSYDADSDTTTWTASSSLTCGSLETEVVSVREEGQSLIIDVGTYDVVFNVVTFDVGSFATRSCSGGASLDIIGDAAVGSVTFNGSGSGTALSLSGNGADVDINVPAFFNDWENGADASAQSSCSTMLTFGSDAIFTGITGTGVSAFETTWEVQGRAAFHDVATPADQRGTGQQSRFGTCVELGPGVPLPASTANYPDPILPFELCEDAIYTPFDGIDLPSGCDGMTPSYDADSDTTTWTASSSLTCGSGETVDVKDEGQSLIIDVSTYDVVFDGVTINVGSFATPSCSGGATLDIIGDAAEGSVTFNGSFGSGTPLTLSGNGADVDINVPAFFNNWENGPNAAAQSSCSTKLTFGSDAIFTRMTGTGLFAIETTWEVQGRAAFYDVARPVNQIGTGQQSRFGTCVELGPGVPLPASTANYPDPILPFELCEDAIYAPETSLPTPTPTSPPTPPSVATLPPTSTSTSPPVTTPTEVDCPALGWADSCGAYTDADSCNCWTDSSFACSWTDGSCSTGGGVCEGVAACGVGEQTCVYVPGGCLGMSGCVAETSCMYCGFGSYDACPTGDIDPNDPCADVGACGVGGQTCETATCPGPVGCIGDEPCRYCGFGTFEECSK